MAKCPECGTESKHTGTSETLVGYIFPKGHNHDDNCKKRVYFCPKCGFNWLESRRNKCHKCDWKGKEFCRCHVGPKVDKWSNPESYMYRDKEWEEVWKVVEKRKKCGN